MSPALPPSDTVRTAAALFGVTPERLAGQRENVVWQVRCAGGTAAALRLHRPGYQSLGAIRSELWWMQALAARGVAVPRPIASPAGRLVETLPDGRAASLIGWIDGRPLGAAGRPLALRGAARVASFHAIGRAVARLHLETDRLTLPDWFTRHAWDEEGVLGEAPFWGRFWENPSLTPDETALLQTARDALRQRLAAWRAATGGGDVGLIHADILRENVLVTAAGPVLIDFDDCGFGFRLYDLATLATQNETEPDHAALMQAALEGYRTVRPLPAEAEAMLPAFVLMRRLASCGWVIARAQPAERRMRDYAERAVQAAARLLEAA